MNRLLTIFILLCLSTFTSQGFAETLTPGNWIEIELQIKELTVEGMKSRYHLLVDNASLERQYEADAETQSQINRVYEAYGTTPIKHQNYGQHHSDDIQQLIMQNQAAQQRFEQISRDFESYVELISNQQQSN